MFLAVHDRLVAAGGAVCVSLLLVMPLLITADVGLRALRWGALPWVIDVSEYILFLGTFLGAPWVLQLGGHVYVDVFVSSLSPGLGRRLGQAVDALGAAVCVLLGWFGWVAVAEAWNARTMQYKALTVPEWPFRAVFTLCMVLLALEFLRRVLFPMSSRERTTVAA
jgi:TRAP-type C4-dicarboxylate transport system permease small subunit